MKPNQTFCLPQKLAIVLLLQDISAYYSQNSTLCECEITFFPRLFAIVHYTEKKNKRLNLNLVQVENLTTI